MNRQLLTWSISVLLILVFSVTAITSCTRIDAGHEGILVKLYGTDKGVQDVSLVTGRVWYNPLTEEVFQFPTFVQTVDYPAFTVNARDGSVFTVDPTISFRVISGQSPQIFSKYRKEIGQITQTTLYNYTRDAFRIQFNQYSTDSIISNRQSFEDKVQQALGSALQKEGFDLEQMTSGLQYPEVIVQAVNLKNKAVQQAMQVENELKVAEAQARKKIVEAEAEARANELRQARSRRYSFSSSLSRNGMAARRSTVIRRCFLRVWSRPPPSPLLKTGGGAHTRAIIHSTISRVFL